MANGYQKIARVDLTSGKVSYEVPDARFCRDYLGGAGFGTYFLMKETSKNSSSP